MEDFYVVLERKSNLLLHSSGRQWVRIRGGPLKQRFPHSGREGWSWAQELCNVVVLGDKNYALYRSNGQGHILLTKNVQCVVQVG